MMSSFSIQEVMKARTKDLEDLLAACMKLEKRTGKQASVLYVMDLTGLKYDKHLYNLITGAMRALSEFMATHYVELIKYFVLVNVPSYLHAIWPVAKPLLPERTRHKVRILSAAWRTELLEFASPAVLPDKWNVPDCAFGSHVDPPIPYPLENYYVNRKQKLGDDVEKWSLAPGKTVTATRELRRGDRFRWWVWGDGDFGFGFFFSTDREEKNVERMDTVYPCFEWMPGPTESPLDDFCDITQDGFYTIWFSNKRAWWHTLNLRCKFTVIPAQLNP